MSRPNVNITTLDGQLGVLPPTLGRPLVVMGVCTSGPLNTPTPLARVEDIVSQFTGGPAAELAAHYVSRYGRSVIMLRTAQDVPGAYLSEIDAEDGTVSALDDDDFAGTSVPTIDGSPAPDPTGAYQVAVLFPIGGTIGVTGIVYQISLDGGSTFGAAQGLGTATEINTGIGVTLNFAAGTITGGSILRFSTTAPILASAGALEITRADDSTSVPTIDEDFEPLDDFQCRIKFTAGGTIGVAGIKYQLSLDDGRNYGPVLALGTATAIEFADTAVDGEAITVNLGAGTIDEDDEFAFPTVAPAPSTPNVTAACTAMGLSVLDWESLACTAPTTTGIFDAIDTLMLSMYASGRYPSAYLGARLPVGAESLATYFASVNGALGSKASTYIDLSYHACEIVSAISGRQYRRPVMFVAAPFEASQSEEVNAGDPTLGALPCVITDALGNPKYHNEDLFPGPDDARFTTLRTIAGKQGVYLNRARLFSAAGSDFRLHTYRRVFNIALAAARAYFVNRLNKPVRVDKATGKILEKERLEIQSGANAALRSVLLTKPKASDVVVSVSKLDNILSTNTLTVSIRITPLGYTEFIEIDAGFRNPALQAQA